MLHYTTLTNLHLNKTNAVIMLQSSLVFVKLILVVGLKAEVHFPILKGVSNMYFTITLTPIHFRKK